MMLNKDLIQMEKAEIYQKINTAVKEGNEDAFAQAFTDFAHNIQDEILTEARGLMQSHDDTVLSERGVRRLTGEENNYYTKVIECMHTANPMQALTELNVVMPKTVIDSVFEDLQQSHPLLDEINFQNTSGMVEHILNTNDKQLASWGSLTAEIVKELTSGFKKKDLQQNKLSAWIPVAKSMLDLGPAWMDRYIRVVLSEALAYGLEEAIINGSGKSEPIGMIRQVGTGVTVTDGIYPKKATITLTSFDPVTVGGLIAGMAKTSNNNYRTVTQLIMVVNPVDYLKKIMPATTVLRMDGTYVGDVLPFPIKFIQSAQMEEGKAVAGLPKRYFMGIGTAKSGKIEFSDEYKFLEDERTYLVKLYGHGEPMDNTSFTYLDISGLQPINKEITVKEVKETVKTKEQE